MVSLNPRSTTKIFLSRTTDASLRDLVSRPNLQQLWLHLHFSKRGAQQIDLSSCPPLTRLVVEPYFHGSTPLPAAMAPFLLHSLRSLTLLHCLGATIRAALTSSQGAANLQSLAVSLGSTLNEVPFRSAVLP